MPRLGVMQDVDARRLSFAAATEGAALPPTARQMVQMWRRDMEKAFEEVTHGSSSLILLASGSGS